MSGVPATLRAWVGGRAGAGQADSGPTQDPAGRRRGIAIALTATIGAIASVVLALIFADADARLDQAQFIDLACDTQQTIASALDRVTDVVTIERAYFESSNQPITREEFTRFSKRVRETLALGLRDTSWAPRVTAAGRDSFEQAARAEGFANFQISDHDENFRLVRAGDRADYFPAMYIDPAETAPKVLGFDLGSEAERRQALTRAWETGQPAVTTRLRLTKVRQADAPGGVITFVPVFAGNAMDRGALRGFVVGILATERLIEHALAGRPPDQDLDVYIFDPTAAADERLIYWHSSAARPAPVPAPTEAAMRARPHYEAAAHVADREWGLLLARPVLADGAGFGGRGLAALLVGGLVTLGVVAYLTASLRHALRLEALTAQLRRTGADLASKGEQIAQLAHYDALTGLPNRVTFRERLQTALDRRTGLGPCVMCLDLDRFKAVNDTFGHHVGDALLGLVAARLRGCLRPEDTAARLGGDEFVVLLEGQDQPAAEALARRLVEAIGQPYAIRSQLVSVGLSVGIAFPGDGSVDDDLLMRNADFALYRAKQAGRSTWRMFEPLMEVAAQARRAMEANLRSAIAEMAFELHFQPLIRLADRQTCGFEALLRWNCPGRGPVSPAEFVPLAEECGLIVPLGDWVLQTACREAARWPVPVRVAINLSPAQFVSPSLVASVERAMASSGLGPSRLELEITETVLLQDTNEMLAKLHALKALGVSIAMDDFGTGYSSLSYLRRFPFDTLKIDQSFMRELPGNEVCRAIVHAVTGLCRTLGVTTVAEGIETSEQLRAAMAEGCDEAQGYLFSRPVPAAQVAGLLTRSDRVAAA